LCRSRKSNEHSTQMSDDFRGNNASASSIFDLGDSATSITSSTTEPLSSSTTRFTLTAKPHAFAGAVLSPKHARELTPSLCLAIASALAEQSHRKAAVPYTLWITEAWRVLGWAEPSAALFWELATMYHTLYLVGRAYAADYHDGSHTIPPILSCGSTSSMGSGATTDRAASIDKKKFSSAASAKELPVWLIGTFLLLHAEEYAYQRNLSGEDESRFLGSVGGSGVDKNPMDFTSLLKHTGLSPRYEKILVVHADFSCMLILFCKEALTRRAFNLFPPGPAFTPDGTPIIPIAPRTFFDICANCCCSLPFHIIRMLSGRACTWRPFHRPRLVLHRPRRTDSSTAALEPVDTRQRN